MTWTLLCFVLSIIGLVIFLAIQAPQKPLPIDVKNAALHLYWVALFVCLFSLGWQAVRLLFR